MEILLVDDEALSREAVAEFLEEQLGHKVLQKENGRVALEAFKKHDFSLVITDICMPECDGLEFLGQIKELPQGKNIDVVLMTGHGNMDTAIEALRKGAYDFLRKPINVEELAAIVDRSIEKQALICENQDLKDNFSKKLDAATEGTKAQLEYVQKAYSDLVGIGRVGVFSEAMKSLVMMAEQFHEERSIPVLIEGETGTGKEVIAHLVHYGRGNISTPFVSINCSAISPNLFESELFGYEKGAFTGANKKGMIGKFELAQGGTLFLDEIGDLPLDMQPKLLRVLQEKLLYRIGGLKKIPLDVRIICATNHNLAKLTEKGAFRKDLFYRLNMGRLFIPPLRERKEDIVSLAQMFLVQYAQQKKRRFRFLDKETMFLLENYSWPGNIRELRNAIERVILLFDGFEVLPEHLSFLNSDNSTLVSSRKNQLKLGSLVLPPNSLDLEKLEAEIVRKALLMHKNNKTQTANYLGITRSALRSRIKKCYAHLHLFPENNGE